MKAITDLLYVKIRFRATNSRVNDSLEIITEGLQDLQCMKCAICCKETYETIRTGLFQVRLGSNS